MAVAQGYGKTVTSGSVFAYDIGDIKNSYIGEPTVNTFGTYPTDLYSWAFSGNACTLSRDTISSPVGNTPLKMVTTGNDAYTNTYNSTGNNIAAASSGQTWTISVWAKANQNTVGQIFHFGANSSGNIIDFSATGISLTTEWTRYTYTRTFTDGNVVAIQARLDGPDTFQSGVIVWWDGLQVEQKAYATQFTTGTRSATQGLLPLIGNSTIDLSNVSFDSNAQMTFDGTNDYVNCGNISTSSGKVTVNALVKLNTVSTFQHIVDSSSNSWHLAMLNNIPYFWNGTTYHQTGITLTTGTWYMITGVQGTTLDLYVNGQLSNSISSNVNIATNNVWIGAYQSGTRPLNGNVAVVQIYNRALSAGEIRQNYLHYKTRFNLS